MTSNNFRGQLLWFFIWLSVTIGLVFGLSRVELASNYLYVAILAFLGIVGCCVWFLWRLANPQKQLPYSQILAIALTVIRLVCKFLSSLISFLMLPVSVLLQYSTKTRERTRAFTFVLLLVPCLSGVVFFFAYGIGLEGLLPVLSKAQQRVCLGLATLCSVCCYLLLKSAASSFANLDPLIDWLINAAQSISVVYRSLKQKLFPQPQHHRRTGGGTFSSPVATQTPSVATPGTTTVRQRPSKKRPTTGSPRATPPIASPVSELRAHVPVEGTEVVYECGRIGGGKVSIVPVLIRKYPSHTVTQRDLAGMKLIGQGGEARVHLASQTTALKLFRPPDDEWYAGKDAAQRAERKNAKERLQAYPEKLPQFPAWMGSRVIGPQAIISHGGYSVGGYAMQFVAGGVPLTKYADAEWKVKNGVNIQQIAVIFLDLFDTILELHACGVRIGDFKPANVLVVDHRKAYLVDAESMAYGQFGCRTFTDNYIDPHLCDPDLDYQSIVKPHTRTSDWYAFTVMLFEALTNINPYDGMYFPPSGQPPIPPEIRALKRISVFNRNVKVPNFTDSLKAVPKQLQEFFFNVFEAGIRSRPKRELIASLMDAKDVWEFVPLQHTCWKKFSFPDNQGPEGEAVMLPSVHDGPGDVIAAAVISGKARYLVKSGNDISRENGEIVLESDDGRFNARIVGRKQTIFGTDRQNNAGEVFDGPFYILSKEGQPKLIKKVDPSPDGTPNVGFQGDEIVWVSEGKLRRTDRRRYLLEFEGSVNLFTGEEFALVLVTHRGELSDIYLNRGTEVLQLSGLPPIMGKISQVECCFSSHAAWLFITADWQTHASRHVIVIDSQGKLLAMAGGENLSQRWFSAGTLRTAYETTKGGLNNCGLAALVEGILIRVVIGADLKLMPVGYQRVAFEGTAVQLLSLGEEIRCALRDKPVASQEKAPEVEPEDAPRKASIPEHVPVAQSAIAGQHPERNHA